MQCRARKNQQNAQRSRKNGLGLTKQLLRQNLVHLTFANQITSFHGLCLSVKKCKMEKFSVLNLKLEAEENDALLRRLTVPIIVTIKLKLSLKFTCKIAFLF